MYCVPQEWDRNWETKGKKEMCEQKNQYRKDSALNVRKMPNSSGFNHPIRPDAFGIFTHKHWLFIKWNGMNIDVV